MRCEVRGARYEVRGARCEACKAWNASRVVFGDRLSKSSVAFYCEHCHHALHYRAAPRTTTTTRSSSSSSSRSSSSHGDSRRNECELLYDDFTVFPYLRDA